MLPCDHKKQLGFGWGATYFEVCSSGRESFESLKGRRVMGDLRQHSNVIFGCQIKGDRHIVRALALLVLVQ